MQKMDIVDYGSAANHRHTFEHQIYFEKESGRKLVIRLVVLNVHVCTGIQIIVQLGTHVDVVSGKIPF